MIDKKLLAESCTESKLILRVKRKFSEVQFETIVVVKRKKVKLNLGDVANKLSTLLCPKAATKPTATPIRKDKNVYGLVKEDFWEWRKADNQILLQAKGKRCKLLEDLEKKRKKSRSLVLEKLRSADNDIKTPPSKVSQDQMWKRERTNQIVSRSWRHVEKADTIEEGYVWYWKPSERTLAWVALFASFLWPIILSLFLPLVAVSIIPAICYYSVGTKGGSIDCGMDGVEQMADEKNKYLEELKEAHPFSKTTWQIICDMMVIKIEKVMILLLRDPDDVLFESHSDLMFAAKAKTLETHNSVPYEPQEEIQLAIIPLH